MKTLYLLIAAEEGKIEVEKYSSLAKAQKAMGNSYRSLTPEEFDEDFAEMSYLAETEAVLYCNGEYVYTWSIETVTGLDMAKAEVTVPVSKKESIDKLENILAVLYQPSVCSLTDRGTGNHINPDDIMSSFVNYSSILSRLIELAAKSCQKYASDVIIEWNQFKEQVEHYCIRGYNFCISTFLGFRESGVDGPAELACALENPKVYGADRYHSIYKLEATGHKHEDTSLYELKLSLQEYKKR